MIRADYDHVSEILGEELNASKDERAHQDFAQLCIGLDDDQQFLPVHLDDFTRLGDSNRRETAPPCQQGYFAAELAGTMGGDSLFTLV